MTQRNQTRAAAIAARYTSAMRVRRWPACVYVLHVFQKQSKPGISTPKAGLNLIDARLRRLRRSRRRRRIAERTG